MPNQNNSHTTGYRAIEDIDFQAITRGRSYFPSPMAWEDEVLYFMLVDRFSDGKEYGGFKDIHGNPVTGPSGHRNTPLFCEDTDANTADSKSWFEAGRTWCGGNLTSIVDKLGYLKRMGVSVLWLSPIFRQVTGSDTYHGYGIQNFLDVEPRLGTREELQSLVAAAHDAGMRVVLDIILNHAGDVFAYQDNYRYYYFQGQVWPAAGLRKDILDPGNLLFASDTTEESSGQWPKESIWPREFQRKEAWTRKGEIRGWDNFPEYLEGDFCTLKEINLGQGPRQADKAWDLRYRIEQFHRSKELEWLSEVYKYWIAFADIDGYRTDTIKHMEPGAVRYFANVISEFAQKLGKENFYCIGEVAGGRAHAMSVVMTTGLDAALGIDDIQSRMEFLAKGKASPGNPTTSEQEGYFELFRNSILDNIDTHQWYGKHIVTMFDDHDQIGTKHKFRFCGDNADSRAVLGLALALNLTTIGIPCIYYGTEQAFNGGDPRSGDEDDSFSDVYLRECMFGGLFGSYRSTNAHFFNEDHPIYRLICDLCALRRDHIALRRGRQYLRQVSHTGQPEDFYYPEPVAGSLKWVIAWSRLFSDEEYVCAINTETEHLLHMWITVDKNICPAGKTMVCLFSTDFSQKGQSVVVEAIHGSSVRIVVPAGGFVVYR